MQTRLRFPTVAPTWSCDLVTDDAAVGGIRGLLVECAPATGARVAPRTEVPVDALLER